MKPYGAKRRWRLALARANHLANYALVWDLKNPLGLLTRGLECASLVLDGMPARWRRVCWQCDNGWGHNVGGKKLGHAPTMSGDEKHAPSRERVARGRRATKGGR